jgi:hypothetical protein
MKVKVFIMLLLFTAFQNLCPQEFMSNDSSYSSGNSGRIEFVADVSLRFLFPLPDIYSLIFIDVSSGWELKIIQNYFSIGIAGDAAIGLDWFALFSDDKDDDDKNDYKDREYNQFGFSLGARIYSSIKVRPLEVNLFLGYDFLFIVLPMPYAGITVFIHKIGIEYAYYLPTQRYGNPGLHQLSVKFRGIPFK